MRVYGEEYFLINVWMNVLSLLLAARLGRVRFRPARVAGAALLGAVYALMAWMSGPVWRGLPALAAAAMVMAGVAFGRRWKIWPLVAAAGLLLSGCSGLLAKRGVGTGATMALCGVAAAVVCAVLTRQGARNGRKMRLRVTLNGQTAQLPALRDSGNFLRDPISGLPVIVAPARALRTLMPPGVCPGNLSTLPRGWYLVRAQTAGGTRMLMCFHPQGLTLISDGRSWPMEAAIALSDFRESRALLPDSLFHQEEETCHASF